MGVLISVSVGLDGFCSIGQRGSNFGFPKIYDSGAKRGAAEGYECNVRGGNAGGR